jgi:hypothetical protein
VSDPARALLRHTLATLAYRGGKAVRDAPPSFADYAGGTRSPVRILAHIGDLMDWARHMADGKPVWNDSKLLSWDDEVERFFTTIATLDARLAAPEPLGVTAEALFQGPIADALTHVGQIAMLRRMAGAPIKGENYYKADIVTGRVGPEQTKGRVEFD